MKAKQTYLKGKSVFTVSLVVIITTILTVYFTGVNYNRSVTANLYMSLSIIATALFIFMTYGLYVGVGLKDDFPKFKSYKTGDLIPQSGGIPEIEVPDIDLSDGIGGLLLAVVFWIGMALFFAVFLIVFEAVFWVSLFIILAMLYWVFFRALKLVFSKSSETKGIVGVSVLYSLLYTTLYIGWIFGIVYASQILK